VFIRRTDPRVRWLMHKKQRTSKAASKKSMAAAATTNTLIHIYVLLLARDGTATHIIVARSTARRSSLGVLTGNQFLVLVARLELVG
jgi:hypothetical protein